MVAFADKQLTDRFWQAFTTDGSGNIALRMVASAYAADSIKDTDIDWGTGADQVSAADIPIADVGAYFTTDNVEAALQELGAAIGGSGAPADATYILQTANGGLTNAQALGALATGILKNTTTTGVLSIAVEGTDYYAPGGTNVAIADGGTNANDASGARTNLGLAIGSDVQAWDADLDAVAALAATAGMLSRTGAGAFAARTLTAPAAGLTISNETGAAGNPTFALANDLAALEGLGSTGFASRTGSDAWAQRTMTGTSNRLTVTNGDGVSGNPTFDISASYVGQATITTLGTITTGTWTGTAIAVANGGTGATSASGARTNLGAAASGVNTDITGLTGLNTQAALVVGPYGTGAGETGELRFKELAAGGSHYTGFKAPDALAGDVIYKLPEADGSNGQVLSTNGSKVLSWISAGGPSVEDKTAEYTIVAGDTGKIFTNRGASTPIKFTLPAAAAGLTHTFVAIEDLIEIAVASGDTIRRPLGGTISNSAWLFTIYGTVELICLNATEWVARSGDEYLLSGRGYVVGGHTGGGEGATVASYEYIDFADDTSVAAGISIGSNRAGMAGNDYTFKAFTLGGWNVSSADQSTIDRITFTTSTTAVATAVATPTMDTARSWPAGCESSTNGYVLGGADRDAGTHSTTVSKLAFVAETEANSGSTIAAARGYNGGISSSVAGYSLGGQNSGNKTEIYKIVFSTDTTSTPSAVLSTATSLFATNECRTNGYKMGGDSNTTLIAKLAFSSDTRTDLAATLDTATSQNIGVSGGKGYTAGGGVSTRIEDLNYATETSAALAATLDTARSAAAGVNPAFR